MHNPPGLTENKASIQNQITATHEAAHAVVAAVAGFEVVSVSIRPKGSSLGRCWSKGLEGMVTPWSLDFLIPRDETTLIRTIVVGRIELCTGALMAVEGWTRSELIRLIRAQICMSLAGHAEDGDCAYDSGQAYPDGHDFDTAQMCLQWLLYLGDATTVDDLYSDFVYDALAHFSESIGQIADSLNAKKYLGRRDLARLLPQPWANWPRCAAPAMA